MLNGPISAYSLNRNPRNIYIYSSGYDPALSLTSNHFSIYEMASSLFVDIKNGAEGGIRTRTPVRALPPQDSVSTRFHHFGTGTRAGYFSWVSQQVPRFPSVLPGHLRRRYAFHNGRCRPLIKKKGEGQRRQHKNDCRGCRQFLQKRGCSGTSKDRLAGTAKSGPHALALPSLKEDDQDQGDTDGHMEKCQNEFHIRFLC